MTSTRLLLAATLLIPVPALACSSCGCTLSPVWENQGMSTQAGLRMDLRYDYVNQDQMRHGSGVASSADIATALANGTVGETEQYTKNHYYTLGADYMFNRDWGVNLQVPYIDRDHGTLGAGDTDTSYSHTQSLGDIKLIGRYQGFFPDAKTGMMLGLKLPTGKQDYNFSSGPMAGMPLDRSLQPGTGSTDLIVGAYHFDTLTPTLDWFAQALYQTAMDTRNDYRPGNALNLNLGVRYTGFGNIMPQLQLNAQTRSSDSGANADPANTGGKLAYLSPGATIKVSDNIKVYGFVQLPVYQYVEGLQLAPRWNASFGINFGL
ncbi:TonB-dependent receptor [Sulfuriferula thiophila]|uniref:TonB-dependent receptor n=1 Tax=Sulfuriferula thiophila TaxID=1781211 RepID=UPI000F61225B|nr:TonB-dependent receptor [Sulfuriferula thiophila]